MRSRGVTDSEFGGFSGVCHPNRHDRLASSGRRPEARGVSFSPEVEPVLAACWRAPDVVARLTARWREVGAVRLDDALAPGLAAELAAGLNRLPFALTAVEGEVAWSATLLVPEVRDPQLFEPLFRLRRFVVDELPALCLAITGRHLVASSPERITVVAHRKGSWTGGRVEVPARSVACTIGVAAGAWPAAWGGYDEQVDASGDVVWCEPLMPGSVGLADVSLVRRVPVLTRHVERLEVRALLSVAEDR